MAQKVRVRFVKRHNAFLPGEEHVFDEAALSSYGDAIELVDPPAVASPTEGVEYEASGLVAKLEETNRELQSQLKQADKELATARARIVELEQLVADYAADKPASKLEPVTPNPPAAETVEETPPEPTKPEQSTPQSTPEPPAPATEPAAEEPAEQPAPAPEPAAETTEQPTPTNGPAWRSNPTGGLNIPGSIKGKLLAAGMTTAGAVWDGLEDGSVLMLEGIGEAKAADLREHLISLGG